MRISFVIVVFVFLSAHADARKVHGFIVAGAEKREVTFEVRVPLFANEPNFERTQYKIRYYDERGNLQTLKPTDADEISFDYEGMEVRMISVENTIGAGGFLLRPKRIFLKLEIDGPLRLYRYYYKTQTGGSYNPATGYSGGATYTVEDLIFQKGNGPLKQPRTMGWRNDMLEYFSDCPNVRSLIENKALRRSEMESITRMYNSSCAKTRN